MLKQTKIKLPKSLLEDLTDHWTLPMFGYMAKAYVESPYFKPTDMQHIMAVNQLLAHIAKQEGGKPCK